MKIDSQALLLLSSTFLTVAALFVLARCSLRRPLGLLVSAFVLVSLLLGIFFAVADRFTGNGVDASVWFHLFYGLDGAGFGEHRLLTVLAALAIVCSVVFAIVLHYRLQRVEKTRSLRAALLGFALCTAALAVHPVAQAGLYAFLPLGTSHRAGFEMVMPKLPPASAPQLNVVYLYLESVERTYLDEKRFPGLTPRLRKLEAGGIAFTDVRDVTGTGWTIAGIVASQCGVPLMTPGDGNSMSGMETFLEGATCLGSLLKERGYRLEFYGGAPTEFAGKGKFFKTHRFDAVYGRAELEPRLPPDHPRSDWGVYDDDLLRMIEERAAAAAGEQQPLALFALTLDTHPPHGHRTPACENLRYGDGSNPTLDAVHCADFLVGNTVNAIRNGPLGDRTLIVVASDHPAMANDATALLEQGDRRNLLIFLPPKGAYQPRAVAKPASTLDIAPTLLGMLGIPIEGLGYGRDLSGDQPTLIERVLDPDEFIDANASRLAELWRFPQPERGFVVDALRRQVRISEHVLKVPVLLRLDEDVSVRSPYFEFDSPTRLHERLAQMDANLPFVWVDLCSRVIALQPDVELGEAPIDQLCIGAGRLASNDVIVRPVPDEAFVSERLLADVIAGGGSNPMLAARRVEQLRGITPYGVGDTVRIEASERVPEGWFARSAGYRTGQTFVGALGEDGAPPRGVEVNQRGITLVGLDGRGEYSVLSHIDPCVDPLGMPKNWFADQIAAHKQDVELFTLVVNDTMHCSYEDEVYARTFGGLELFKAANLVYREPYIAVVDRDGRMQEFAGHVGRPLVVRR